MSWENDEYAIVEKTKPTQSLVSASRVANRSTRMRKEKEMLHAVNELREGEPVTDERILKILGPGHTAKDHSLTLTKKDIVHLQEVPAKGRLTFTFFQVQILILRDNEIKELNTLFLPPKLKILDLRNNKITKVLGEFPPSLEFIWLDDNKLQTLPKFPPTAISVVTTGNPIKAPNAFESEIRDIKSRTQMWMTSEIDQKEFSPSDLTDSDVMYRFYPIDVFDAIKQDSKDFIDDTICRGNISSAYLKKALETAEHLILEVYDGKPIGMSIFNITADEIFISLLCAHKDNTGGGSRILKTIQDYFYNHPSLKRITLESVADARGFYEKLGFKPCIEGQLCPMQYTRVAGYTRSKRQAGGAVPKHHFHFHSEQVHSVIENGHHRVRRNAVTVKNGKGKKTKEILDSKRGKTVRRNSKPLTKREIANIQKGVFMPRLFKGL